MNDAPTPTPCSIPECNTDGNGEPCDRHETEQAHAEGEHAFCGAKCEATTGPAASLTVADLQAALALLPSRMPVILAKDGEGNGFSPLASADPAMYAADTTWSGEHYMTDEQRHATGEPDEYSAAPDDAVPALFLWPVN